MRNTTVATLVAVFMISGTLGCKSASKLAFWKPGDSSDVESTALAHSAPSLPADIAKQAEALASSSPSIDIATTTPAAAAASAPAYSPAPAYVPPAASVAASSIPPAGSGSKAAPSAYPSTAAPSYASTTPANVAATVSSRIASRTPPALYNSDQSANLGSVDMPYDPNAVPPAKTIAASTPSPATPTVTADRYGTSSVASAYPTTAAPAVMPTAPTPQPQASGMNRYASVPSQVTAPVSQSPATSVSLASSGSAAPSISNTASTYSAPSVSSAPTGDRYAAVAPPISTPVTPTSSAPSVPEVSTAPAVSTAPQVASAQPYRPGGTSSYEGFSNEAANVQVASRPGATSGTVPNVSAPASTTNSTEAPRYR